MDIFIRGGASLKFVNLFRTPVYREILKKAVKRQVIGRLKHNCLSWAKIALKRAIDLGLNPQVQPPYSRKLHEINKLTKIDEN